MIKSLAFPAPFFHSVKKEEELEMKLIIDRAYVRKPLYDPNSMEFGELLGG